METIKTGLVLALLVASAGLSVLSSVMTILLMMKVQGLRKAIREIIGVEPIDEGEREDD